MANPTAGSAQAQDSPDWVDDVSGDPADGPESPPWEGSSSAAEAKSEGIDPASFEFPAAAKWDAKLGAPGSAGEQATNARRPVGVAAADQATSRASAGQPVNVEVFGQGVAERVGARGFVFEVSDAGALSEARSRSAGGKGKVPAQLSIDYSEFADAFGGDYGARLRVVALPDCALADPVPAGCEAGGRPLPVENDGDDDELVVTVDDLAGLAASSEGEADTRAADDGVAVFAVTSGVGGESGSYGASPLSNAGEWNASGGSGAFSWGYPVELPAPAAGSAPQVGLSYSSATVDGMTIASNTQASQIGLGWSDFADGFIERSYEPCVNGVANEIHTADLCWGVDNAMISLNGVSGSLVQDPVNTNLWRLESDPGWRIERISGGTNGDHFGEHWKVTGRDGTVYWFGLTAQAAADVPVFADHPTDPCHDLAGGPVCQRVWRWMLERVEDPDGNLSSYKYRKQVNRYACLNGLGGCRKSYTRNLFQDSIEYGARAGQEPSARVSFGWQYRCGYLHHDCGQPTADSGSGFPDTPVDLICGSSGACSVHSPSFFSTIHYTHVLSEVKKGGTWETVAQENLIKTFADGKQGEAKKLELLKIQRVGTAFGGDMLLQQPTVFSYKERDNRADNATEENPGGNAFKALRHDRLETITNPLGAKTTVAYAYAGTKCELGYTTDRWDQNVQACFPQSIKDDLSTREGIFHKYVVASVSVNPAAGAGSPITKTTYSYEGTPAWAFDPSSFGRWTHQWGWSRWLGYESVVATTGNTKTRQRVFRGWDGDYTLVQNGADMVPTPDTRRVNVTSSKGATVDSRWFTGNVLEEQILGTVGGQASQVVESTVYKYKTIKTADRGRFAYDPHWSGVESVTKLVATAPGTFKESRSTTTYDETTLQPVRTLEEGWLAVTGDERCSLTTYANDPARNRFAYPATNKIVAGGCASTDVLSASETYYDASSALGALGARGNPTKQRSQIDADTWSETSTEYDASGRPVKMTDPNGGVTTTDYVVTSGYGVTQIPVKTIITNAAGHKATTDWHPQYGVPAAETDPNGNKTTFGYDALGRTTWVRRPGVCSGCYSFQFAYSEVNRAVSSRQLMSGTAQNPVYQDVWEIADGLGRPRQTQSLSPTSGVTIINETTYTAAGQVLDETGAQGFTTGKFPGVYHAVSGWENRTRHVYDNAGRETGSQWWRGSQVAWSTSTSYGADTVTTTGPGGTARETIDAYGRTIKNEEKDGASWVTTTYGFDLADRLTSVTDPDGNAISYSYDMAGRRVAQTDPNRGDATFDYDLSGNQTSVTDANGDQIHTLYDNLGRPTERRSGSPTGTMLASWKYDTADGGIGQVASSTSHAANGNWVSSVTGYDSRGRAEGSKLTVPSGIPGLSGSYTTSQTYDQADRTVSATVPAVGGLPEETLTTTYNSVSLATSLTGAEPYVSNVAFDNRGRPSAVAFGPQTDGQAQIAANYGYNADQRLAATSTFAAGSTPSDGIVASHNLSFNTAGSITQDLTKQDGQSWRECFGYDARQRMTSAYTVAAAADCATGEKGSGDEPYNHTYAYSRGGNLNQRTEDGTTTGYTYPAAGADRPNAPSAVGAETFEWDAEGQLIKRTKDGTSETYSWDVQGWLAKVSGPDGDTSFTYNTGGERLLRTTPEGSTLYWAGHEITATTDGSTVTAVRSYSFSGSVIATRSPNGVEYLAGDVQGSLETTVPSGGGDPNSNRTYEPYGQVRSEEGDKQTDRGFVGQIEDSTTNLSYMNARYYDADTGIFISADSVVSSGTPESLNPYTYAAGSPATLSDPSGLSPSDLANSETMNWQYRFENKMLRGIINAQSAQISKLQGIINDQARVINELFTHIDALNGIIREQQAVIGELQARVVYLEGQVAYWYNQAQYWKGQAMYWKGQAMYWRGQAIKWHNAAMYWKGRYQYLRYNVVGPAFLHIYGPDAPAQLAKVDAMTWNVGDLPSIGGSPKFARSPTSGGDSPGMAGLSPEEIEAWGKLGDTLTDLRQDDSGGWDIIADYYNRKAAICGVDCLVNESAGAIEVFAAKIGHAARAIGKGGGSGGGPIIPPIPKSHICNTARDYEACDDGPSKAA